MAAARFEGSGPVARYWLANCEGFRVRGGLSGTVEELLRDSDPHVTTRLVVRTRRYAAYQRKWMRRVPGLVSVAADRPPDEVADEIVEVARARQRLPAGRAG